MCVCVCVCVYTHIPIAPPRPNLLICPLVFCCLIRSSITWVIWTRHLIWWVLPWTFMIEEQSQKTWERREFCPTVLTLGSWVMPAFMISCWSWLWWVSIWLFLTLRPGSSLKGNNRVAWLQAWGLTGDEWKSGTFLIFIK